MSGGGATPSALEVAARFALSTLDSISLEDGPYSDYENDRLAAVQDLRAALDFPAPEEEHDDTANYPVPEGLRRKAGVEYGCGKDDCGDCYEPAVEIAVGARVRLRHDVDRYPHFIAREGATGTVTTCEFKGVGVTLYAKMDEHIPGCEDWDNEVCWDDTLLADVLRDIELLG